MTSWVEDDPEAAAAADLAAMREDARRDEEARIAHLWAHSDFAAALTPTRVDFEFHGSDGSVVPAEGMRTGTSYRQYCWITSRVDAVGVGDYRSAGTELTYGSKCDSSTVRPDARVVAFFVSPPRTATARLT